MVLDGWKKKLDDSILENTLLRESLSKVNGELSRSINFFMEMIKNPDKFVSNPTMLRYYKHAHMRLLQDIEPLRFADERLDLTMNQDSANEVVDIISQNLSQVKSLCYRILFHEDLREDSCGDPIVKHDEDTVEKVVVPSKRIDLTSVKSSIFVSKKKKLKYFYGTQLLTKRTRPKLIQSDETSTYALDTKLEPIINSTKKGLKSKKLHKRPKLEIAAEDAPTPRKCIVKDKVEC
eukprot:TRINITY_DN3251_c0_g1_i6.p1 TRINITY_DN3251_c0_g1~~TRINITY_DN3251_c0_g1_i6.p1  ORF type:complete len:235 (+),score=27.19 TRINITY_DN3251_c0_g1_i6:439-1143(+)